MEYATWSPPSAGTRAQTWRPSREPPRPQSRHDDLARYAVLVLHEEARLVLAVAVRGEGGEGCLLLVVVEASRLASMLLLDEELIMASATVKNEVDADSCALWGDSR